MKLYDIIKLARESYLDDLVPSWDSDDSDCLWSNEELTVLANEGERAITERQPIMDAETSAVTDIPIAIGETSYALDSRIMYVHGAVLDSTGEPLAKTDKTFLNSESIGWRNDEGDVQAFVSGLNTGKLLIYRIPIAIDALSLEVARRPLADMRWRSCKNVTPEISENWHSVIAHWIAYKAFLKQDADTYNSKFSQNHFNLFNGEVGPPLDAVRQRTKEQLEGRHPRVRSYY